MMKKHLPTYKTFDVVTVPFPFVSDTRTKIRPALVLSSEGFFNNLLDHSILAMITSAKNTHWPQDIIIQDFKKCGLVRPCVIRFKLFTIDNRLIIDQIGQLSKSDRKMVCENFSNIFNELSA